MQTLSGPSPLASVHLLGCGLSPPAGAA